MASGYTQCRCRDCFEIAISDDDTTPDFCNACEDAGCEDGEECRCENEDWDVDAEEEALQRLEDLGMRLNTRV